MIYIIIDYYDVLLLNVFKKLQIQISYYIYHSHLIIKS